MVENQTAGFRLYPCLSLAERIWTTVITLFAENVSCSSLLGTLSEPLLVGGVPSTPTDTRVGLVTCLDNRIGTEVMTTMSK